MTRSYALHKIALSLFLLSSHFALAIEKNHSNPKVETESLTREKQLKQITVDANTMAILFASELTLLNGDIESTLKSYLLLFNKTKRPEIAQRAMQLAIENRAFSLAEHIYQQWLQVSPEPNQQQKQMRWKLDVLTGNTEKVMQDLPDILANSSEEDRKQIFLYASQTVLNAPNVAKSAYKIVHKQALQFKQLQEAAIADTIYATMVQKNRDAVKALQRLAILDGEMQTKTKLTLSLLTQKAPEILKEFFEKTNTENLSDIWQSLHVDILISMGESKNAYSLVLRRLDKTPSVILYTQAGFLATVLHEPLEKTLGFFDKAYALGNTEERSKAALFATISGLDANNIDQVRKWVDKIGDTHNQFDKYIVMAALVSQDKDWQQLDTILKKLDKLEEPKRKFFTTNDVFNNKIQLLIHTRSPQVALQELQKLMDQENQKDKPKKTKLSTLSYYTAMIYSDQLQQYQQAITWLKKYLDLNPDSANAFNSLGYTMLFVPEYRQEGLNWIEKAHKKEPNSPAINDSLGWAYYLNGNSKKALHYLEFAYQNFKDAEVAAHLGEVLWSLNKKDEALKIWKEAYLKNKKHNILNTTLKKYHINFK